ncbi:phosphate signaling complex protein PhoU [Candidatus Gracilibacteria bacterium]|nr:phosphate signaling complex protein PhoU [Candidatus Gracilibacteria bacterium]
MRVRYDRQITHLRDDLLRMGSMVEYALQRALKSLETWDTIEAAQVSKEDVNIDEVWRSIEAETIRMLAIQQPILATDLRFMTVVIAIAGELERIGDYANSIAKRVRRATSRPSLMTPPNQLNEMATLVIQMIHTSLDSFLQQSAQKAEDLVSSEERVDLLAEEARTELINQAKNDPIKFEAAVDMLDVVYALERSADRATNIAERVIFMVTAEVETIN